MNEINYSIIIPHKDIPNLLQRCLNSIPRRKDIQIIVVDDNSTPEKVDFEHFPGIGEPCVEVYFTKEGKGAGYARNIGLKHAKGKWLLFADADDFYSSNMLSFLDEYLENTSDIIYFDALCVDAETLQPWTKNYLYHGSYLHTLINLYFTNPGKAERSLKYKFGPPWCKMIKKSFLDYYKIRFDEVRKHNDTMFSLKIGYYSNSIIVSPHLLYYNVYRKDSITNRKESKVMIQDKLLVFYQYEQFCLNYVCRQDKEFVMPFQVYSILEEYLRCNFMLFIYSICFLKRKKMLSYKDFFYLFFYIKGRVVQKIRKCLNVPGEL